MKSEILQKTLNEIELTNRHAEQLKILRRAISNRMYFLRRDYENAPTIAAKDKIAFAYNTLQDILDQTREMCQND